MYRPVTRALNLVIFMLLVILLGTCGSSIYLSDNKPGAAAMAAYGSPLDSTPQGSIRSLTTSPGDGPSLELTATFLPSPSLTPVTGNPPALANDRVGLSDWSLLQPGLERRVIEIYNNQNQPVESLYIWRLDQKYFRMEVAFDENPKSLEAWQGETKALMVINGGFYSIEDERYFPDGLIVVDGEASGHSFNHGGMLAIQESRAELRWLAQEPYQAPEPLQAALQSFPMLVEPGGTLGFGAERESNASARRTAIGQDKDGRILLMVAPQGYFTLHQLSRYLTESDLNLDIAVNLDGGGSTGILVANPYEIIPPTRALPFVILVYAR